MGRKAAYHVRLDDGREVGFGLVVRDDAGTYSVQFKDTDGKKYIIRTTNERSRPRAVSAAERIVREHYRPPEAAVRSMTWEELLEELPKHLDADGAREATVKDYLDTLRQARTSAVVPAAVSAGLAQQWCNRYLSGTFSRAKAEDAPTYSRSPRTLHARVRKLRAIWGKYLVKRLRLANENPWETVDLPKLDRLPVRTLSSDQVSTFFEWLAKRWQGWELPTLFFEVKAVTGCRLGDLCNVRTADLKGKDRLVFTPAAAKARKERVAVLPADIFAKLKKLAGPVYLWECYAADIPKYLKLRGVPTHRVVPEFDPERLCWWAKDEVDDFNKAHPDKPKLKSHDFRKRAVTEAHRAGLDVDTAAAAVGMSASTARGYYLAMDQDKAAAQMAAKLADTLRPGKPTA
jgi:integrase